MKIHIVSCRTIEREVRKAMQETGLDCPVSWVESGLHNFPKKLNVALQEILDGIEADCVLLALGSCGNSLAGLKAGNYQMVFPRVDDCISMLLGSVEARRQYERTYFLTKGWLEGERTIYDEYKYTIKRYGPEVGEEIMQMMLGKYRNLGVLDTGTYDYAALTEETAPIAEALHLEQLPIQATDSLLKKLLLGPWTDEFCIVEPYGVIRNKDLIV